MGLKQLWGSLFHGKTATGIDGKATCAVPDDSFGKPQPCPTGGPNTEIMDGGPCDFDGQIYIHSDEDVWAEFDDAGMLGIYTLSAVVYACVNIISSSYAKPPLELGRENSKGEWKTRSAAQVPMLNVIEKPNAWYSLNDLEQVNMKRKLLTGAAFTWKWRNNGGEVTELWPLPTCLVTIGLGKCGIDGYWLNKDKPGELWVPAEDMIYDRFQCVKSMFGYQAPLLAALKAFQIDSARMAYLMKMIGDINAPGLVIEQNAPDGVTRQGLTDKQRKDLRESLAKQGTGGTPILPPGLTMKFPGVVKDLDWEGVEGDMASRICMAFGVAPVLIGARIGIRHTNYSNYGHAKRSFYDETMTPLWEAGGETWTRHMITHELKNLPKRASSWEFQYNLTDIAELQEDVNERMDRGVKALAAGAILVNEFRTEFADMEEVDDGNVYLRASSIIVEPVADTSEARADAAVPEEEATPDVGEVAEEEAEV